MTLDDLWNKFPQKRNFDGLPVHVQGLSMAEMDNSWFRGQMNPRNKIQGPED